MKMPRLAFKVCNKQISIKHSLIKATHSARYDNERLQMQLIIRNKCKGRTALHWYVVCNAIIPNLFFFFEFAFNFSAEVV